MAKPKAYMYCYDSLRTIKVQCLSYEAYKAVRKYLERRKSIKVV